MVVWERNLFRAYEENIKGALISIQSFKLFRGEEYILKTFIRIGILPKRCSFYYVKMLEFFDK